MKKLISLLLFVLSCVSVNAQDVWQPDTVISAQDKTPEQILICSSQWAATTFAQLSPTISSDDNSVVILLNIPFKINNMTWAAGSGYITGQIKIQARDGRFKVTLSNFNHFSTSTQSPDWWSMGLILESTPEQYQKGLKWKQKREVYKRVLEDLNEFKEFVFTSAATQIPNCSPKEEEDW
ncbi:MAG: DUF4468 domain-containing protein [Muribaculaceae bacterium]|nr:DUF4468 domain-containing protein [Muribaculaceae bacterium]